MFLRRHTQETQSSSAYSSMLSGGECELSSSTKSEATAKMDDDELSSSLLGQVNAIVIQPQLEQQKLEQKVEKQEDDDEIMFLYEKRIENTKEGEKTTDNVTKVHSL